MQRSSRKFVAIFLLVYALADLTVPGLCRDESFETGAGDFSLQLTAQPGRHPASKGGPDADDCFCCCSHILPSLNFTLAPVGPVVSLPLAALNFLASLAFTPPHQPPRL